MVLIVCLAASAGAYAGEDPDHSDSPERNALFPGQLDPRISDAVLQAYDLTLTRRYDEALAVCEELSREFPKEPTGPAGLMVIRQVMMLENEDYRYDDEFQEAVERTNEVMAVFEKEAPKNDWYYTIMGAAWGIEGIYYLRKGEYLQGLFRGVRGLNYMRIAERRNPRNWEARMGIGLYLYYRSAYASFIPVDWLDRRAEGIAMVKSAGQNRAYLEEIGNIALFYIYTNEEDYDRAFKYIDALIEERPDFPIFYQFAGRALYEAGRFEEARQYYRRMSEVDPELYYPYFRLGECELALGNDAAARRQFVMFLETLGERESVHREPTENYLRKLADES